MSLRNSIIVFLFIFLIFVGCSVSEEYTYKNEPYIPDYYAEHVKGKENLINDAIISSVGNYASLIFFTDAHWGKNQKHSPALIKHINESTPINVVVFGGDVITTSFKNPQEAIVLGSNFRQAFDSLDCSFYYLYGNHDNNSDGHPTDVERHLSDDQVYDYLQKGMSTCSYGGYFNFYFDQSESKTRFLCLDTGRYYYSQFQGNTIETVKYLIRVLNETPEGWKIVLLSHLWLNLKSGKPYITSYMKTIIQVLDDYNSRKNGVFRYKDDKIDYYFADASSKIICCIGGHCHLDTTQYSDGGIPIIITTTDSEQTINGQQATIGTIEEQAVSVFVFDYKNNKIKLFRIGRGSDMEIPLGI